MSLAKRLGIIVACAVLGLMLVAGFALSELRATMLADRRAEINTVLELASRQVLYFQSLEREGKLTRQQAQAKAIEALSKLRDGKTTYVWARTVGALGLVLPFEKDVGKVDFGAKLPDGRFSFQQYLDQLAIGEPAYVYIMVKKPGTDTMVMKINQVKKIGDWDWIIGFGVFTDDIDAAYWSLAWRFIGLGALVLLCVVGLAVTMARSIYRQLGGEPEYAARVAQAIAAGDLSQQLGDGFSADSVLASVAGMQSGLRQMIEGIQRGADLLGQAVTGLTGQMAQINQASRLSADATSSTAAAIEQMSVSIDHISSNARETELNSAHSSALAGDGEKKVNQAAGTIQGASEQISMASTQIEGLLDRSRQIGGIASVIKDIADQTNLLALNAAIEAARAGEQGRGFAVVADEVRKLAERTTKATTEISVMVSTIQDDTGTAMSSMNAVTPQVVLGVSMANEAAAALREISAGAAVTLDKVRSVAAATAEQTQASTSVAQNVERIAQMVEESAESVRAANANVQMLEKLAGDLRESVTRFHL
ncbi:methyl-accepting chemotaxis protein [Paludibacterium yongneupense]|uniref:methyl-accepting chemotaxis protein n=1 Tax=Paludibacterium yongneupense TaxID=400061 RepID=UPI00048AC789|nr:methyl-accepting chemotaxis protein [Paludibacterium yongneupense]